MFLNGFLYFEREGKKTPGTRRQRLPAHGWKFQFSIDDTESDKPESNLARGWNIVERHLVDNEIRCTKIIPSRYILHEQNHKERGKQITIFAFKERKDRLLEEWQEIFQNIENDLVVNGILPSYPAYSCKPIPGSNFIYYRNDKGRDGRYISTLASGGKYNLSGEPDPYEQLRINTPIGFIQPKEWTKFEESFRIK